MSRKTAIATLVVLFSVPLAAEEGNGDTQAPRVSVRRGFHGDAVPGAGLRPQGKLTSLEQGEGAWIYSGRLPLKYSLLDLTEEQSQALDQLASEAREEARTSQQEAFRTFRETRDPFVLRNRHQKMEEMRELYEQKISDLLTDEQKAFLKKIEDLQKEQQQEIQQLFQHFQSKLDELARKYDTKLEEMLSPGQKEKLEELLQAQNRRFDERGRRGRRRDDRGDRNDRRDEDGGDNGGDGDKEPDVLF